LEKNKSRKGQNLKERAAERLSGWDSKESVERKNLKEFLDTPQGKKYISDPRREKLLALLDNYDGKYTGKGISCAVEALIVDVYSNSKNQKKLSEEEIAESVERAADEIVRAFSEGRHIKTINIRAEVLSKRADLDEKGMAEAIRIMAYDPDFYKTSVYSASVFAAKANYLRELYDAYPTYSEFFRTFGFELPRKIPLLLSDQATSYFDSGTLKAHILPAALGGRGGAAPIHELTHYFQYRDGDPYSRKELKGSILPISKATASIFIEAGTLFTESVYNLWYSNGVEGNPANKAIDANLLLKELKAHGSRSDFDSEHDFKGWINALYTSFKKSTNHRTDFSNLTEKDFNKNKLNRYLMGSSLASLTFACNDFGTEQTLKDLVIIDTLKLMRKLSGIIKRDEKDSIIENLFGRFG
jgi:hypothetical protein